MSLHRFLFYLLILLLPTQLGRHFWPSWAFVNGIRLDYLSPTIHLTDIIILGILGSWLWEKLKTQNSKLKTTTQILKLKKIKERFKDLTCRFEIIFLIFTFSFLLLNAFLSTVPQLAIIKLLKLTELFLLAVYVAKTRPNFRLFVICFLLSVFWSSLLAWAQFLKQSSLGGIFWLLGERTFTVTTPGIATAILNGRMLLRPYSTFPHPNVLAGYLTVLLPLLFFSLPQSNQQVRNRPARASHLGDFSLWRVKFLIFLSLATILITFSRSAWVAATLILFAAFLYYKSKRVGYSIPDRLSTNPLFFSIILLFIILFSPLLFSHFRSITINTQSLILRQELNRAAIRMIKNHPLTGVGLNNFLVQLPNYRAIKTFQDLQPTHNIYLLIAAETGLVGLGIFLFLIFKTYQQLIKLKIKSEKLKVEFKVKSLNNFGLLISLTSILLLGLTDHYFFTLQQTQALFAVILGLTFTLKRS